MSSIKNVVDNSPRDEYYFVSPKMTQFVKLLIRHLHEYINKNKKSTTAITPASVLLRNSLKLIHH